MKKNRTLAFEMSQKIDQQDLEKISAADGDGQSHTSTSMCYPSAYVSYANTAISDWKVDVECDF